jgi:hypothetical protein
MSDALPQPRTDRQRLSWLRWSVARFIANSRLPQASALIPAIGYALLWSDDFNKFLSSKERLGESLFSLDCRLQLLWWGAILMTVAWLMYLWKCPKEIRRSGEPDDYVLEQFQAPNSYRLENARLRALSQMEGYHPADDRPLILGGHAPNDIYKASERVKGQTSSGFEPVVTRHTSLLFTIQFHAIDHERLWWRITTVLSLATGAVVFLLPSLDVFVRVLRRLL